MRSRLDGNRSRRPLNRMRAIDLDPQQSARCATLLFYGVRVSGALLVVTYTLYACGLVEPLVPISVLSSNWSLPASRFMQSTSAPEGWDWVSVVAKGDYLNMLGIVLLGGTTIASVVTLAIGYLAARVWLQAGFSIALTLVLVVSFSGLIH